MSTPPATIETPSAKRPNVLRLLCDLAVALIALVSLASFFDSLYWRLENVASFRVQQCVVLLTLAILYALFRRRVGAVLLFVLALFNATAFAPLYFGGDSPSNPELRVMFANLHVGNPDFYRLFDAVNSEQPDILILAEIDSAWGRALEPLKEDYPYHLIDPERGHFGMALFSRVPLESLDVVRPGPQRKPTARARVVVSGKPLTIFGTHPYPPITPEYIYWRNGQMSGLSDIIAKTEGPVLLIGDLNMTSNAGPFRDLVSATGLRDSRKGFGVQTSWPINRPYMRIAIDHCLVTPAVRVSRRWIGPDIGSDHFPVLVDIALE